MARYFPNEQEKAILELAIKQYFKCSERSIERSRILRESYIRLKVFSNHYKFLFLPI